MYEALAYCFVSYDLMILVLITFFKKILVDRNQKTFRPKKSAPSGSKVCNLLLLDEMNSLRLEFSVIYIGCTASTAYRCNFRKWQLERSCSTSSWRGCQRVACCQQSVLLYLWDSIVDYYCFYILLIILLIIFFFCFACFFLISCGFF